MQDLTSKLAEAGIDVRDVDLSKVGAWQYVPTEDKPRKTNGHIKIYSTSPLRATYMNMATNVQGFYVETSVGSCFRDRFRSHLRVTPPRPPPKAFYADAAGVARHNWTQAEPACEQHPYLQAKRVKPHGIRQLGSALLVPMYDADGVLWSTQRISADGSKYFQKGARKSALYYPIADGVPQDMLFLVEGFATGATVREAIGCSVAVAFDAGNLVPVAGALAHKYPDAEIIIAADNDVRTQGNPGVTKATEAANFNGGRVVYPTFPADAPDLTDWNDLHVHYGLDAVREILMGML